MSGAHGRNNGKQPFKLPDDEEVYVADDASDVSSLSRGSHDSDPCPVIDFRYKFGEHNYPHIRNFLFAQWKLIPCESNRFDFTATSNYRESLEAAMLKAKEDGETKFDVVKFSTGSSKKGNRKGDKPGEITNSFKSQILVPFFAWFMPHVAHQCSAKRQEYKKLKEEKEDLEEELRLSKEKCRRLQKALNRSRQEALNRSQEEDRRRLEKGQKKDLDEWAVEEAAATLEQAAATLEAVAAKGATLKAVAEKAKAKAASLRGDEDANTTKDGMLAAPARGATKDKSAPKDMQSTHRRGASRPPRREHQVEESSDEDESSRFQSAHPGKSTPARGAPSRRPSQVEESDHEDDESSTYYVPDEE